ncbi:MAG: response regulator transcription factor [Gammaproteobacteria bacterium]|jgi:DNA-binding response OmpR family regulator|uniref:response regulator n=1 Tax=Nevskia sp. TaxID=1929292 RepID=UPI004036F931|nr:response regulator transcription factor [Gammaproteobacteria bacterium]
MSSRILIADDDRDLADLLADYLRHESYTVETVHDGASALERLASATLPRPDLLILDVMMPGRDGLETLKELRQRHGLPVIMLSARGEPVDRVIGLELGADDYLAKPCLPRELLARVRARLRTPAAAGSPEPISIGGLHLDLLTRRASLDGRELELTGAEFSLLLALGTRLGQVVDKAVLTREGLGREIERFDRAVDVHISRLRRKLAEASPNAPGIDAVRGSGYQLIVALPG